jgi:two-component sensor histidine kinase
VASPTPIEGEPPHPLSPGEWTIVSPAQLGGLRAQLRTLASRWALPEDCTDRLLTVANELAANAIDHARTSCHITIRHASSIVRVLVADDSPLPPRVQPHDAHAARGRGLQMVQALANRWGWTVRHRGKTVWAAMNCDQH